MHAFQSNKNSYKFFNLQTKFPIFFLYRYQTNQYQINSNLFFIQQTKHLINIYNQKRMGSCMNKDPKNMKKSSIKPNENNIYKNTQKSNNIGLSNNNRENFGINHNPQKHMLSFIHSPLRYCQFLFSKFKKSDGTPEQASLSFMLNKCVIDIQKKQISLYRINSNLLKIWIVYGGIQKVSQTGLTTEINNYKQLQQIKIIQPSSNHESGDLIGPLTLCQTPKQSILIIMQPVSQSDQTIFMIYRYQIISGQKQYSLVSQWLQWSSLAFRINDIYGSEYLFKCGDQNEVCSICLTNISECILLPCRHMCVCRECLQQVEKTKPNCPLCRKEYYSVVNYQASKNSSEVKSSRFRGNKNNKSRQQQQNNAQMLRNKKEQNPNTFAYQ